MFSLPAGGEHHKPGGVAPAELQVHQGVRVRVDGHGHLARRALYVRALHRHLPPVQAQGHRALPGAQHISVSSPLVNNYSHGQHS